MSDEGTPAYLPLHWKIIAVACLSFMSTEAHAQLSEDRSHVRFDESMIVAYNRQGAVAVVFESSDDDDTKTVTYRWRSNDQPELGEGTLLANGKVQTLDVPHVHLSIKPTPKRGNLIFDPATVCVHPVQRVYFEEAEDPRPDRNRPPAELTEFLAKDKEVQEKYRTRRYNGQTTEPSYPRAPLTFKVRYRENGLVVATPQGIAVFAFGEPISREAKDEVRRGTSYQWRFISTEVDKSGDGEVWELYRNQEYITNETRHHLEAGHGHIPWSINGMDAGWIYYDPAWQMVWLVSPQTASQLVDPNTPGSEFDRFRFGDRPLLPRPDRSKPNK